MGWAGHVVCMENRINKFIGLGNLRERSIFEDLHLKRRIYCMQIGWEREECIDMSEDWVTQRAAVHMVMNTRVI